MDKPGVYIETSIVSYLAARPSRDPVALRNQQLTHAWWSTQRDLYALWTSDAVFEEAAAGAPEMARQRLILLASLYRLRPRDRCDGTGRPAFVGAPATVACGHGCASRCVRCHLPDWIFLDMELHAHREPGTPAPDGAGVPGTRIAASDAVYTEAADGRLTMWEDPIVAEVHKAREQILARFDYDLAAYGEHLKKVEAENRARGIKYVDPPVRSHQANASDSARLSATVRSLP
jgi:hypothetical protein